jgi:hypothetical protein
MRGRGLTSALAAALLACVALAHPAAAMGVAVAPDAAQRLGIATQPLVAAERSAEIDAFAKVLDPAPLVQTDSDLRTAEAAARASAGEARRASALNRNGGEMSAKDAEAALAQSRADALRVRLLRRQLALAWGPGVARLDAGRREALARGLAAGTIALVHVDTHNNAGQAGARSVRVDIGDGSVTGRVIGPARIAEPRLQSSGLIVEVTGPQAMLLAAGLTQSAHIATASQERGVLIPRSAVIRAQGSALVYIRSGAGFYERRLLPDPVPGADGYFEAHGPAAGDTVVVRGATALFAAEQSQAARPD